MTKVALITGANRGLGFEISKSLIDKGWKVWMAGKRPNEIQEAAAKIGGLPLVLDISNVDQMKVAIEQVEAKSQRLDALINNAGIFTSKNSLLEEDEEVLKKHFDVNAFGALRLSRLALPLLSASPSARIINMSSSMGQLNALKSGGAAAYRISKSLLNAMTIMMADELANRNIKVVAASPGWVRTDMGGQEAPLSLVEGADTLIWLAETEEVESGNFYRERSKIDW